MKTNKELTQATTMRFIGNFARIEPREPRRINLLLISLVLAAMTLAPRSSFAAAPAVDNAAGATSVQSISAILNGTLSSTSSLATRAYVYWGKTDGGTTTMDWSHTDSLGIQTSGPLSISLTSLSRDQKYYYRFFAVNEEGATWASSTTNFTTLHAAGPAPVNLGSTAHFTILAGAAVTTTGGGLIRGDVGASPIAGSAIGIPAAQVSGTIYAVDASGPAGSVIDPVLLTTAKGDLSIAFNDAAGRTPVPSGDFLNPGAGNIGGMNLAPGLYKFTSSAAITGSDLTLTGGPTDVWIFQIASDLHVGSMVHIILEGGAQPRNIFWQVGTSAVIDTFAVFKGTIIADQSVVMKTSSTMDGRALAFGAEVTFNGTGGDIPIPEAPFFTEIWRTNSTDATVVLETTPYFPVTIETSPDLLLGSWTPIVTTTPITTPWSYLDIDATSIDTQRFYRAFITTP